MSEKIQTERYLKKLDPIQRRAAEKLLLETKPYKPVPTVLVQWLTWLVLAVVIVVLTVFTIKPQAGLMEKLNQLPNAVFMLLVFTGSALSAWGGIASSMPGREPGTGEKTLLTGVLISLFVIPFLFFTPDTMAQVWSHSMESGWFCFRTVLLVALPSWALMGWMVSRNASFSPAWTGAWLGISAFLLGTGTIQIHCEHWESYHMFVDHLLPMVVFIVLPIWIGSFWFSRWKK
jgi:hypothetical protein